MQNKKKNFILKVFSLLTGHERKILILFFLILVSSILELLTLSLLVPFLSLLTKSQIQINLFFNKYNLVDFSVSNLAYFLILIIFVTYMIKFIFNFFLYKYKKYFFTFINNKLNDILLIELFKKNLLFINNKNSSEHIILIEHIGIFSMTLLPATINILIDILTGLFVFSFLLYFQSSYNFFFIGLILTSFISFLIFHFLKKKIYKLDKTRHQSRQLSTKYLYEILMGLRDIKLFNAENYFKRRFINESNVIAKIAVSEEFLRSIPKFILEFLILMLLLILISVSIYSLNYKITDILFILGILILCSYKLIPIFSRILANLNTINLRYHGFDILYNFLKDINNSSSEPSYNNANKNNISIKKINFNNVNFRYDNNDNKILKDISFQISSGDIIFIKGTSGSGKTTLLNLLCGLIYPTTGKIVLNNSDNLFKFKLIQNNIAYVPQSPFLIDGPVWNNIAFGKYKDQVDELNLKNSINKAEMEQFIKELSNGIDTIIGEKGEKISGGQRQRIGIARALYRLPEFLILDEATNAIDSSMQKKIIENIKDIVNIKTIVIVSHDQELKKFCNKVFELKDCKLKEI